MSKTISLMQIETAARSITDWAVELRKNEKAPEVAMVVITLLELPDEGYLASAPYLPAHLATTAAEAIGHLVLAGIAGVTVKTGE